MKTKNIIKTLVLATVLVCACDKNETAIDNKGYTFPVTINVTRQGDEPASKATFNESTKKLEFSSGDQLLVKGYHATAGGFAGILDFVSDDKFSGTITTDNSYEGTADALFSTAYGAAATLLPAGYGTYGFLVLAGSGSSVSYSTNYANAIAGTKATAVEQFSIEDADSYSSGFALVPNNAILNFTITDLAPSTDVTVNFTGTGNISKSVTTDASGTATFAIAELKDLKNCSLTVGGNAITLVSSSKTLTAGKIYNITRSAAPAGNTVDLSTLTANYEAQDGDVLTGTLAGNYKITVADGATVTLDGVTINGENVEDDAHNHAGISLAGDGTIILSGTNTVKGFYEEYAGIYVPSGKTVTIQGDGSLNASSNGYAAGIGGGYNISCGNITIEGGTITATGGANAAGIGGGRNAACGNITITDGVTSVTATKGSGANSIGAGYNGSCGTVTIGGTVYPDGISTSPYTYDPSAPAVTSPVTWNSSNCSSIYYGSENTFGGIKLSCGEDAQFNVEGSELEFRSYGGGYTFTAPDGKQFTSIQMYVVANPISWRMAESTLGDGWSVETSIDSNSIVWSGKAASVDLAKDGMLNGVEKLSSIVFTFE